MRNKTILSTVLAAAIGISGAVPAVSAPALPKAPIQAQNDLVTNVDSRRGFKRRGGHAYFNGHRGRRHARRGWRQHNGWWFPPAAFALGLYFGNQIAPPTYRVPRHHRRAGHYPRAHYAWCDDRYISYREWDNSFQPYHGPRRQCYSPYS